VKVNLILAMLAVGTGFLCSLDARATESAECSVDAAGLVRLELLRNCDPACEMCSADFQPLRRMLAAG
jgi:hypothetical protein